MAWRARVRLLMRRLLLAAVATLSATPFVRADYPDRPITIIVCFPAGGGADIAARLIGTPLGEALGGTAIIENRGGAGGNIGITAAMRAPPDGYTLLVCSSAFVVKLNWTSPGAGTTPYLAGEVIKLRTGITMEHIPFAGAGPATTAVLGGQVDMYSANIGSVSSLIEGGKVRPLAVTALKRWPELPEVPTLEELGIKDAVSDTFYGLYAPAGTPQPIIGRIAKELAAILARPDVKEKFAKAGMPVVSESPAVFRQRIAREVPMYKEIVDKAGLKIK